MKVLDRVWVVASPGNSGIIYCMDSTQAGVWAKVEREEVMGTGVTAAMLRKRGYVARKVAIVLEVLK